MHEIEDIDNAETIRVSTRFKVSKGRLIDLPDNKCEYYSVHSECKTLISERGNAVPTTILAIAALLLMLAAVIATVILLGESI